MHTRECIHVCICIYVFTCVSIWCQDNLKFSSYVPIKYFCPWGQLLQHVEKLTHQSSDLMSFLLVHSSTCAFYKCVWKMAKQKPNTHTKTQEKKKHILPLNVYAYENIIVSVYNTNYFLLIEKSQYIWEIDSSRLWQCIVIKTKHIIFFGNISELLYGLHFKSTQITALSTYEYISIPRKMCYIFF